jgi:CRP-like cAMP-binding protein
MMSLSDNQLLLSYRILCKVFPEDLHIARPLIQMLLDRHQKEQARDLALSTARRLLAIGNASHAITFLAMCQQLDHPEKDEIAALFNMARITSNTSAQTEPDSGHTFALIEQLSDTEGLSFLKQGRLINVEEDKAVVKQGDRSQTFYLILEGNAEVQITIDNGHSETVTTLGPGHFFGELACVYKQPRSATVIAREKLLLLEFSEHFISQLMNRFQLAGEYMMRTVEARMVHAMTYKHPAFIDLPETDRLWLAEESSVREYADGELVPQSEVTSDDCYIMLFGKLEVIRGNSLAKRELITGDMFGNTSQHIRLPMSSELKAKEHTLIAQVPGNIFNSFMNAYVSFETYVKQQSKKHNNTENEPLSGAE